MKKRIYEYLKSIAYVFFVQFVTVGAAALTLNVKTDSDQWLVIAFLVLTLLLLSPLYFFLKRNAERPIVYLIFTSALHITASLAVLRAVEVLYTAPGFGGFNFAVAEIMCGIWFTAIALIDIAVMICKKFHRTNIKKTASFPEG